MRNELLQFLYDGQSFVDNIDRAKTFAGDAGIMLPRELEFVKSKIEQQVVPTQTLLTLGINIDNTGGYADTITKLKKTVIGGFKRNDGQGGNTDGTITVGGEYDSISVMGYKAHSEFDVTNLEQAKIKNTNLLSDLILGHNSKYMEMVDKVGYVGDGLNKQGILNYDGFTKTTSAKTNALMTDEELYEELKTLILAQNADVGNELFYADKLVTSVAVARRCKSADYKANTDLTIAKKLEKDFGVTIVSTIYAKDAGASGTGVAVALCTAEQAINIRVPVKLKISPIKTDNFEYSFSGIFRYAGVDFSEDVSRILQGL